MSAKVNRYATRTGVETVKRLFYIVLGFGLGTVGFVVWNALNPSATSRDKALDAFPEFESPNTPVVVETVRKRDLVRRISSEGVFRPRIETRVVARVSGQVHRLHVGEGSFVREGDIVIEIDGEPYRIAYMKAKDQMTRALREYAALALVGNHLDRGGRLKKEMEETVDSANVDDMDALALASENSRKAWLASSTGLTRARLDVAEAKLKVDNTVIRARFNAYVTDLEIGNGGTVAQGQDLMRLVGLDSLTLEVGILERELPLARVGAPVSIRLHAFSGEKFGGTIRVINPVVDSESGMCDIQIWIDNPEHRIKPGMFAKVDVETRVFRKRLLVPRDALLVRDDRKLIFVHEGGLAKWRYVRTGLENDELIEIEEGLIEGEELIVSGHFNLAHDASVIVVQR